MNHNSLKIGLDVMPKVTHCAGRMYCIYSYYVSMCRYFHKQGLKGEESLEQIVPTLSDFCDYVEK